MSSMGLPFDKDSCVLTQSYRRKRHREKSLKIHVPVNVLLYPVERGGRERIPGIMDFLLLEMALLVGSLPFMLLGEVALSNFAAATITSSSENPESGTPIEPHEKGASFDEQSARFIKDLWHDYGGSLLTEEGRRKHYRKVFPVLVTGFMVLMSLMVPLGFQFMAMIGGKALLMSKMALVLASLQNFKRANIAPPVYPPTHTVSVPHLLDHHGFHERYSPRVGVGVVDNRVH